MATTLTVKAFLGRCRSTNGAVTAAPRSRLTRRPFTYTVAERIRTRPSWRNRSLTELSRRHDAPFVGAVPIVAATSVGPGGGPVVVGSKPHPPPLPIRTTLDDWVMYRHPWESTAAKSPRLPPLK